MIFLDRFAHEVSKPVAPDALEHIEYVPTQIVTEYFRHAFEREFGLRCSITKGRFTRRAQPASLARLWSSSFRR